MVIVICSTKLTILNVTTYGDNSWVHFKWSLAGENTSQGGLPWSVFSPTTAVNRMRQFEMHSNSFIIYDKDWARLIRCWYHKSGMEIYLCGMTDVYKIDRLQTGQMQQLIDLVNSAYRGEESKKGWTTEADLIEGSLRTDLPAIKEMLEKPGAVILTCSDDKHMLGCVYLHQQGTGLYLGMLSVSPVAQGLGIGKKLLIAAEMQAQELNCDHILMTVIDVRHELIAWYERHGYISTRETKPFDSGGSFGIPRQPLQFIILKKAINI